MRVLVLARHAKAEVASFGKADHSRVLVERGKDDARELGEALTAAGIEPDVAYVSDAARTLETWEVLSEGWAVPEVHVRADLYAATVATLTLALCETPPGASTVIVVGHQPTMSNAAAYFAGQGSNRAALQGLGVGLQTAAAAVLEFDGEWADLAKGAARLRAVVGRGG